ncbi:MAG TPA: aminopeptidase P family protein [Candidatus Sulfotelmatobacter sp.]|nr:aminopeptidase P family protein [Candidatus Sulfotelmatobacter sp.]
MGPQDQAQGGYRGDAALQALLDRHGGGQTVAAVCALLRGIDAASVDRSDDGWLDLIAPGAAPALASELRALRAALAAARPARAAQPLAALRAELARRGLGGFIVPRADEHQGEYVPACAQRLAWLTGFTGSAGLAIVLTDVAAIWVDGRYTLQVRAEVDLGAFETLHVTDNPPGDWLATRVLAGAHIGFDPRLHVDDQVVRFRRAIERAGGTLIALDDNPLDAVWSDRPPGPLGPVRVHDVAFAGKGAAEKRAEIAGALAREDVGAAVLTAPDSIAWLLNIRGADVPHTPLPLSFGVLHRDETVELFIDARKLMPGVREHLGNAVTVAPPDAFGAALDRLGAAKAKVLVDAGQSSAWVLGRLTAGGAEVVRGVDPCALPKACKNPVELDGTRAAHRRDGAALTRFMAWLPRRLAQGELKEIEASDRLEAFRREDARFRDLSFPTISGAGPNGAIVHYRASPASERPLEPGQLYLVDSGAQYLDGTTDVTRTIAIGQPSAEQRDRFTRVLKGHIAIATARFPTGTTGSQLDTLARRPLWDAGLDFDHGTGHGVGSYLSVHEGPQRISKLPNTIALKPGMILSDEPGYYRTGAYGIRIENLVVVTPDATVAAAEREMLGFEILTLAPIDLTLVERDLLSAEERAWLNVYHARVRDVIGPQLDAPARGWLDQATRAI